LFSDGGRLSLTINGRNMVALNHQNFKTVDICLLVNVYLSIEKFGRILDFFTKIDVKRYKIVKNLCNSPFLKFSPIFHLEILNFAIKTTKISQSLLFAQ
jgi:hypothetical protein